MLLTDVSLCIVLHGLSNRWTTVFGTFTCKYALSKRKESQAHDRLGMHSSKQLG